MTTALIDGDVILYRCGYTTEDDPEWIARARLRESIANILQYTQVDDHEIWLTDSVDNWRMKLFPNYKANRKQPKPKHYEYLSNLLTEEWGAQVAFGQEADDAMGIRQCTGENTIICTIDKDLQQIPGRHFNFVTGDFTEVTPWQGLYKFYYQLLVGDSGDNITVGEGLSCAGIGPKKAQKILEGCEVEKDLFECVQEAYNSSHPETARERMLLTGQLVKIRTKPDEIWEFPKW